MMNLCINCVHHESDVESGWHMCHRFRNEWMDVVTGRMIQSPPDSCNTMRRVKCEETGKYYEEKV